MMKTPNSQRSGLRPLTLRVVVVRPGAVDPPGKNYTPFSVGCNWSIDSEGRRGQEDIVSFAACSELF